MAHRTVAAILILLPMLLFTLPAQARQKVAPTFRSAQRRGTGVPPVTAAWPRWPWHVGLRAPQGSATPQRTTPAKPFTQDQVQAMVRDGLADETGAKAIEQRGIDFAPTEDFIQSLKTAGASQAFLAALRAAKPPEPAGAKKPLNQVQVFALLVGQVPSHRVAMLVQERGIDFEPTDDYLQEVRLAGGEEERQPTREENRGVMCCMHNSALLAWKASRH